MNDNDFLQQYLGALNTEGQNGSTQTPAAADQSNLSEHSSHGHRANLEQAKLQQQPGAPQPSREADGQSTDTSEDSEAAASPQVKESLQQDTGNSDSKTAKHAAKLRSQDLQEKNRKAQRRFRERQNVVRLLADSFCAAIEIVCCVRVCVRSSVSTHACREGLASSVQPGPDIWLRIFERPHHIESVSCWSCCDYDSSSILQAKVSELEQKVAEQQRAMTVLLQDKANLESRVNIFVRVLQMRDEQIEQIRSGQRILATKDKDEVAESFKDDLTLTVREGQPLVLTPSQVKNMTLEDMVSIWKEYVNELAQGLVGVDKNPQDVVAAEKIKRLCNESTILCMRVAISNPVITKSFVACQLEDNCIVQGEEPPEMWLSVARSLLLSPEQRSELIQLRRLFISKLSSIIDQRKEIYTLLTGSVPSAIGARHTAIRYLQSHECVEKLKRNMREEHVLKLDWISTLFKHLLTPVQVARCIVQGWPYTPDTLAICSWVAAEDGDAGALAVLTAPTRSAPTAGANWAGTSQSGFAAGDLGSRGKRGSGPLTGNVTGQSGEGHLTSLAQLPMSVPSNDTTYDLGPSASTQHHSGSQPWSLNEPV